MNTIDLDAISLEQALIDFEVANARVIDLTARLTSMSRELLRARSELEVLKLKGGGHAAREYVAPISDNEEIRQLRDQLNQIRSSRAVRIAAMFGPKLRRVL
ncbi:MAG TPA: hypothetical protein VJ806_15000 [Luteimonas sp.]|nr:hypothetical protein [Luteimonas sp.]